ncbi:GntR family transcriptional regulator [Olsenella sp. Marseille-P4559]|uniref:GntR family transcriptional regulator n=1 Tax=Olsenella sp. Marseille-P4559 TaxID=2364795 RepID=UPI001031F1CD|nr:GntR family transcriptional regulator [Olsenella sp. Marseille-P4559]
MVDILLSNASGKPIYEQVADGIRAQIMSGDLKAGEQLPSIRQLAANLRISAITTKRAYSDLEAQGFIATVSGKGSFVAEDTLGLIREEQLRLVETNLATAVKEAHTIGLSLEELRDMLNLEWEES